MESNNEVGRVNEKKKMQNSILKCQLGFHFPMINSQLVKKSSTRKRGK